MVDVVIDGALAGARGRSHVQVGIRVDGSVVLPVRATVETRRGAISADFRGYAIPDPDAQPRTNRPLAKGTERLISGARVPGAGRAAAAPSADGRFVHRQG